MAVALVESHSDPRSALEPDRRAHSLAVGRNAEDASAGIAASLQSDLAAAAALPDVVFEHADTGFHALDGARFLAAQGFSAAVCHLVVRHSASTSEAEERRVDLSVYADFAVSQDSGRPMQCCGGPT